MKTRIYFKSLLLAWLIGLPFILIGRDAPVTTANSSLVCPGSSFTVPVTVNNFTQVTGISLRLDFNPQLATYTSYSGVNTSLPGVIVNKIIVSSTLHKIMISWSSITPTSLVNGAKLLDLKFVHIAGSPAITFNNTSNSSGDCEYSDEASNPMYDFPTTNFYHDALIQNNVVGAAAAISGPTTICQGQTDVAYSVASINNATGYLWTVPTGATIVSGDNTPSIVVNYGGNALSGNISVKGTNTCGSGTSSSLPITVIAVETPIIAGQTQVCIPNEALVYSTQTGQTNYQWTISEGGSVLAGQNSATATVLWTSSGIHTISVGYTNAAGCSGVAQTSLPINVSNFPIPSISGPQSLIIGSGLATYSTEPGMSQYNWSISPGGSIVSGAGSSEISVLWETIGNMSIGLTYTNTTGCASQNPSILPVIVNASNAPKTYAGSSSICPGDDIVVPIHVDNFEQVSAVSLTLDYNPNLLDYKGYTNLNTALVGIEVFKTTPSNQVHKIIIAWSNIIPASLPDSSLLINLKFTHLSGSPTISFNNTDNGGGECEYADASGIAMNDAPTFDFYSNAQITNLGVIKPSAIVSSGPLLNCQGQSGYIFEIEPLPYANAYHWTLPQGGSITSGQLTNSITASWSTSATSGYITVYGSNACGIGEASEPLEILINPLPANAIGTVGLTQVLPNQSNVTYALPEVEYATGYSWLLPPGAMLVSGTASNTITVNFSANAKSGYVIACGTNDCGQGIADTLEVRVGYNIDGYFRYNNLAETALDSVLVKLSSAETVIDSTYTSATGYYRFEGVQPGLYTIAGSSTKPWGGVNATDAIKIQRHFAGLETLSSTLRQTAADVNNSNSINSTDAAKVKRRFSGLDSTFLRTDWTFAKASFAGDTIQMPQSDITRNYSGLCTGDVNGSHIPNQGDFLSQKTVLVFDGIVEITQGQDFELSVKVTKPLTLGAASLAIDYPEELIAVQNVTINHQSTAFTAKNGQLLIAWSELEPLRLVQDDELLKLTLKLKTSIPGGQSIELGLADQTELADEYGETLEDIELTTQGIKELKLGQTEEKFEMFSVRLFPNPASEYLNIHCQTANPTSSCIQITDVSGRIVYSLSNLTYLCEIANEIPVSQFPSGIYFVVITLQSDKVYKKIQEKIIIQNL